MASVLARWRAMWPAQSPTHFAAFDQQADSACPTNCAAKFPGLPKNAAADPAAFPDPLGGKFGYHEHRGKVGSVAPTHAWRS